MMLAVLEQRGRISALGKRDIYSATVGGVKLSEPAADLAVALALASAASDTPLPKNLVAIGEVGLAGEVRRVTGVQRRLAEAHRLGGARRLVGDPEGSKERRVRLTDVGRAHDEPQALASALSNLAITELDLGHPDEAITALREAQAAA